MASPKKYFHDHLILLLLSVNAFLALAGSIFVIVRLNASHATSYIVQYRPSLGADAFQTGSLTDLLSFIVFLVLVLAIGTTLSLRAYAIHRQLAISILGLGILLMIVSIVISNALLMLR